MSSERREELGEDSERVHQEEVREAAADANGGRLVQSGGAPSDLRAQASQPGVEERRCHVCCCNRIEKNKFCLLHKVVFCSLFG